MDSTLLIAVLVGTITIYVLEFVWHMALPFHQKTFKELNDENSVLDDLSTNGDGSGMYFLPNYHSQIRESTSDDEKKELMLKQQEAMQGGPVVFVAYSKNGTGGFGKGLLIQLICDGIAMFIAGFLITQYGGEDFGPNLGIVLLVAASGIITNMVPFWNWWGFSTAYTVVHSVSVLINWAIAGTVLIQML